MNGKGKRILVRVISFPQFLFKKNNQLQDDASITHCQSLITGILDAIHCRFEHMFADNELHLATLTDPFFKLSWLDNEDEIRRAKNLLKGEYVRFQ